MNFEKNIFNLKEQSLKKMAKVISAFVAAGIITFGPGVEGYKSMTTSLSPEKYIEYSEKQPGVDEIKAETMIEKLRFLEKKFSPRILPYLKKGDEMVKINRKNMPDKPTIAGFDKTGINNEDLAVLWSDNFYPKGTVDGNISNVKYSGARPENVKDYNIGGEAAAMGSDFSGSISFYDDGLEAKSKQDLTEKIRIMDWHFAHEIGHSADWVNRSKMGPIERVEFIHDVAKEFEKPGSFRDIPGYIDSINNPDKQKETYYKVREYWAVLCEQYLTFPEYINEYLSKDEIALVKKWLQRENKDFDSIKASQGKKILIENMAEKGFKKR